MAKALNGKELGKGITQLRNGTYQARVYIKGNDKPIYASSKSLEEVKQKREKILEQYNLGLQTDGSKKTLNDWFDEWMELYVVGKVKPRTVQNYIRVELSIFVQCLNPQNYAASANGCSRCLL